jgi:hypothetical protein
VATYESDIIATQDYVHRDLVGSHVNVIISMDEPREAMWSHVGFTFVRLQSFTHPC